jgi:hypothetical protein
MNIERKEEFIELLRRDAAILRGKIYTEEKELVKKTINDYYSDILAQKTPEEIVPLVYLQYFEILNEYAQKFESVETYQNVLKTYKDKKISKIVFDEYPIRSKLVRATTQFMYYNLIMKDASDSELRSKTFVKPILEAKSDLTRVYNAHLEDDSLINDGQLARCLVHLGGCLAMLSRWYESIYYLNLANKVNPDDVNVYFLKASVLDRVEKNTCSDYNGLLLLEVIDASKKVYDSKHYFEETRNRYRRLAKEKRNKLARYGVSIRELRKHKIEAFGESDSYNTYLKFCLKNELFMTEHSIYCKCKKAIRDDIKIETDHGHTKIPYLKPYEEILDTLSFDFILARKNYFHSLDTTTLKGLNLHKIKRGKTVEKMKITMLKESFKTCYSIMDTVAIAILQALEIDYTSILTKKDKRTPNIYFTNIWTKPLFKQHHFDDNYYLQTLYSIAQELSYEQHSGLKDYKKIRNAIEHKIFHVISEGEKPMKGKMDKNSYYSIHRRELENKTLVLLVFTKSLLFTYVNFMRRLSVRLDENSDHN